MDHYLLKVKAGLYLGIMILFLGKGLYGEEPASAEKPETATTQEREPKEKSVEQIARESRESIVVVSFTGREGKQQGLGTGFVVREEGLIATNLHVIGEARPVSVQFADGKSYPVVEVFASDKTLDLALIKIAKNDLKPLKLQLQEDVLDGQTAVALGNPLGLKHSVVSGVISGQRDVEGRQMLQLAMPIERGNSGGPVLDAQGRVVGITTLKSMLKENLGFAVPVGQLKLLLDKPNPVPMSQWLTIGKIDEADWKPLFGANWRQRAGKITVDGTGDGFGGRSLLLSQQEVPTPPYEIAVRVKLDQADGAAGLVFGADGQDRHYGFYPSSGNLRLSKFNGPSVYSWQVLKEVESYQLEQEDWNLLKVRVEKTGIQCYLNGQLVIELPEAKVSPGLVGLAKFRHTSASFKQFQFGTELDSGIPTGEEIAEILQLAEQLQSDRPPTEELTGKLTEKTRYSHEILESRADELEQLASRLRQLSYDVHRQRVQQELQKEIERDEGHIDLLRASLLLSWLDNRELEVDDYVNEVDRLAGRLAKNWNDQTTEQEKFTALNQYLFEELGFHGSRTNYYHRSNSYMNEVLDDREGLPILLSVLYIEVAKRLGLHVEGVGLPGHFVVRFVPQDGEPQLLDPFEQGKLLSREDASLIVLSHSGKPLEEFHLQPQSERDILIRILRNLIGVAQDEEENARMLHYFHLVLTLDPESAYDHWLRAVLSYQEKRYSAALMDLDWLDHQSPPTLNPRMTQQLRSVIETRLNRPAPRSQPQADQQEKQKKEMEEMMEDMVKSASPENSETQETK